MNLAAQNPTHPTFIELDECKLAKISTSRLGLELAKIFKQKHLSAHFQPIIDLKTKQIFSYEALIRGPFNSPLHSPVNLFQVANDHGLLFEMDTLARSTVLESYQRQQGQQPIFINITVTSILAEGYRQGITLERIKALGVAAERVVIELTELQPIEDFNLFIDSINHYRKMGFKVALDDLGGGYNGLRLWSELRPDFVKIDKHFILGIAKCKDKQHFLASIHNLAKGFNTKLVAEGIENPQDLAIIEAIGIDYAQGFLFKRPQPELTTQLDYQWPTTQTAKVFDDASTDLRTLLLHTDSIDPSTSVHWAMQKMHNRPDLDFIPVVESGKVLGMIWRREFMDIMAKRFSYDLHHRKPIFKLMDDQPIVVEVSTPVETLSRLITENQTSHRGDAFIITEQGQYQGCGRFLDLLRLITDLKIKNAQYANPLSGLPGNVPIQRQLKKRITEQSGFCVIYIDADHFKPYNDFYSYEQGDDIIRMISTLIQQVCQPQTDFIGHIGGDDFMIISANPQAYQTLCPDLIRAFKQQIADFYSPQDQQRQGIEGINRNGERQFFPMMALSLGVLVVPPGLVAHQQKLSGLATKAKKQAKHAGGNTWVVINAADETPQNGEQINPE